MLETVLSVLGVLVPAVIVGGTWLSRKWDEISATLKEISAKLNEHETAPTRDEISVKLKEISDNLNKHEAECEEHRKTTAATLGAHGKMLENLQDGQAKTHKKLNEGQAETDKKLKDILDKFPSQS